MILENIENIEAFINKELDRLLDLMQTEFPEYYDCYIGKHRDTTHHNIHTHIIKDFIDYRIKLILENICDGVKLAESSLKREPDGELDESN